MKKRIDNRKPLTALGGDEPFMFTNQSLEEVDGAQRITTTEEEVTPGVFIRQIVYNLPKENMTFKDIISGGAVVEAVGRNLDYIELYFADFEWFVGKMEKYGPQMFGAKLKILVDALKMQRNGGLVEDITDEPPEEPEAREEGK